MSDHRFPKTHRVKQSERFTMVLKQGGCAADGCLVVFALKRELHGRNESATSLPSRELSRLGVTIPKKTGNAVVRNRWKRLIREAFRTQRERLPTGFDYIVRPKKGAEPDSRLIHDGLPRLAARAVARIRQR